MLLPFSSRRKTLVIVFAFISLSLFYQTLYRSTSGEGKPSLGGHVEGKFRWSEVPQRYAVNSMTPIPIGASKIPQIQHIFAAESEEARKKRLSRRDIVRENFLHAWNGYKQYAWLSDELMPETGRAQNPFGGWAATLVDALDTLWIMDLKEEFEEAVAAINQIDFSTCALEQLNVFETTIRYLGGFLSAYDLSGGQYPALLEKAKEMGHMLYKAFDTPNRMPITRWYFKNAAAGALQEADDTVLVAEIGSLTLEFTRLSQLTGDSRYFDAVQRIMDVFDEQQNKTKLPGMWPVVVNAKRLDFADYFAFTVGGMADSMYEYLPKQHMLLGGATAQYQKLYEYAATTIKKYVLYRPMTPSSADILFAGDIQSDGKMPSPHISLEPRNQHLSCFIGGMFAIGAKIFSNPGDLTIAKQLVEGCLWAYEAHPRGIMPEIMYTIPCPGFEEPCGWDEGEWLRSIEQSHATDDLVVQASDIIRQEFLPKGVANIPDTRYILRPEAIESVFVLYRITGDEKLLDRAWNMFENIIKYTRTDIAHAGLDNCVTNKPPKSDRMESFWLAETLKYFYLIFSEPELVSLDEYVLNTEAHPLRRPV